MLERACGFESHSRHQTPSEISDEGRKYTRNFRGDVAKRPKAGVCKTSIRRFESARRLQSLYPSRSDIESDVRQLLRSFPKTSSAGFLIVRFW